MAFFMRKAGMDGASPPICRRGRPVAEKVGKEFPTFSDKDALQ
jgi:hypothetical protein